MGPDPYPVMVRDLQRIIGDEARVQFRDRTGGLPDAVVACVGGGSNAMGIFTAFLDEPKVQLFGIEATGEGIDSGRHAATMAGGRVGVYHGMRSLVLQTDDGQLQEAHSISAGLDYPGIGPEHARLHELGRARYLGVSDEQALDAMETLAQREGIIPALETAHALAALPEVLREVSRATQGRTATLLVNLSGRGDKDMHTYMQRRDVAALEMIAARQTSGAGEEQGA
jgi:tryptophan synthase beta chain